MAHKDYSGTPLPKKLGIKEGSRVGLVSAPPGFEATLDPLPTGIDIAAQIRGPLDVIVFFTTRRIDLEKRFAELATALDPDGRLWVAWPKKAAGVDTDLDFETVQRIGLNAKLVDNKSASVDDLFQGLQFVYRLKDRPK